ncbi:MAG: TIGR03087 family PEP-CTERM/XrtA system glycosyltransferase [Methylomonas sp.]|jgi:sugar transferase (PEP-CTERM/EpsH1 system associated)|uniref:TIGR03087 family PEP-CTERM/XrtA system glycosyltransferase n=1 Tax=Methylomonas sp. TaxID=418 RepID=UPI0025D29B77|nr:TIGR03087 family PEP-CTERM/XrtA system glycosyltransferase [Methylomonas sp.]MCK9605999.1 TIGR03087 family PEP-CTERM/XrtA system glycosyltransferase [Methylomonas sp.]
MTKLLYLVHRIPYPPNKGDKIRSFHFLKALAEKYEVYLGTFIDDPDDKQYIDTLKVYCKDSFCIDLQPKFGKLKSLTGFLTGEALSLPYYRNSALQAWVDNTIAEQNIEYALIFSSPMAQYLKNHPEVSLVADFVDVDSDKWRQYAGSKNWPGSWVYQREAQKLLDFETHTAGLAKSTVFVSEQEAQLFKQLAPENADKISFVNNGVDTEFFDPQLSFANPFAKNQAAIVFTGAMDYWANVDAVVWFAQQVFPWVKEQVPEVRFYVVGSKPTKAVQQLADNDASVIVTGRVDDVRNYVAHACVVVAPLRIARGIQNKVLEAMAMAKPIVATSAAMEGIPGNQSLEIAVADNPQEFASQVVKILQQPMTAVAEHRRYVQADFSWQHNGERLCQMLSDKGIESLV